jgi:hypothetical protein
MTKSLNALVTKLHVQYHELLIEIQLSEQQTLDLQKLMEELELRLHQSSCLPHIINPELEVNRLNFIAQEHANKEALLFTLKDHSAQEDRLKSKLLRIKSELKVLEQYMDREEKDKDNQQKIAQEHALDEWALQSRKAL